MPNALQFLIDHGASVLFRIGFIEQVGLPIPAIPFLITAGPLIGAGKMSMATALLIPVARSLPPDMVWDYLGKLRGGKVLGFLCRMSLEPDSCVRSTQNAFLSTWRPRTARSQVHSWIQHSCTPARGHRRHGRRNVSLL